MIKTISNLGISPELPKEMISKIRFSNICGAYLAIACALSSPMYYFLGQTELGLFLVPITIGYGAVTLLNASGFYAMARSILLSTFILGAFYYASRLGPEYCIQYLLITGILGIQALYVHKETVWRNSLSIGTFILWLIYESKVFNPIPRDLSTLTADPILPSIMILMVGICLFGSVVLIFHYIRNEGLQLKEALSIAEKDSLTGLGTNFLLKNHNDLRSPASNFKLIVMEINGLRRINEMHGWDFGDEVLKFYAHSIKLSFPDHCNYFRLNPTLFAVWAPTKVIDSRLEDSLHFLHHELESSSLPKISFSVGSATTKESSDINDLINLSQLRMIKYVQSVY